MNYDSQVVLDYTDLSQHVGHSITVAPVFEGDGVNELVAGASIDCESCGETIAVVAKDV